jgi:2'-5' RNA ligase
LDGRVGERAGNGQWLYVSTMIRLFVAIPLPDELRRRAAALCRGIAAAKWVDPDNMHLTLRFIGEVDEPQGGDIVDALDTVGGAPFALTLSGAGHFGSDRRVRAVWLGVEKSAALNALQARIESALARAGLAPEGRKFHPHVTLARMKSRASGEVGPWLAANTLFRAMPFTVEQFALYSSQLGGTGAVYTAEAEFPLGARTGVLPPAR